MSELRVFWVSVEYGRDFHLVEHHDELEGHVAHLLCGVCDFDGPYGIGSWRSVKDEDVEKAVNQGLGSQHAPRRCESCLKEQERRKILPDILAAAPPFTIDEIVELRESLRDIRVGSEHELWELARWLNTVVVIQEVEEAP